MQMTSEVEEKLSEVLLSERCQVCRNLNKCENKDSSSYFQDVQYFYSKKTNKQIFQFWPQFFPFLFLNK